MSESQGGMNAVIDRILKEKNGILRTEDVLKAGFSKTTLGNLVKSGELEQVAQGVYVLAGEMVDELFVLQLRSSRLIFSHETALWMNGLSDRVPLEHHVTVRTRAPLGLELRGSCRCHYVQGEFLNVGLEMRRTAFGNMVRCYNAERTICDLVRDERKVGVEAFVGGIKAYADSRDRDIAKLMGMAQTFGVERELSKYMGVLS